MILALFAARIFAFGW